MGLDSDLRVVLRSMNEGKVLRVLFLLSLVMDADMICTPILIRLGLLHPSAWSHGTHVLVAVVETVVISAATILWLWMLCACMFDPVRPMGLKLVWGLVFLFTTWFGAQFFYVLRFTRWIKHREPVVSSSPPAC